MSDNLPFFSILLPTYNRAEFLGLAIKSVLQQTFVDFELIISNGGSTDRTSEVVAEFNDSRIHYVETKQRLNMGENYQNALSQAKGEYVVFFSDDDALIPSALQRIKQVVDTSQTNMVAFRHIYYVHEKTTEYGREIEDNSLAFYPFSEKIRKVSSEHATKQMFGGYNLIDEKNDSKHIMPFIGTIACRRSILEELKSKFSNLFATIPIDIYFIVLVLSAIEDYFDLDEPLLVWSRWMRNSTASSNMKGENLRKHYENLLQGQSLSFVPLKFPLPTNCYANAVLQAKNDLKEKLGYLNINWNIYFVKIYEYLVYLKETGVNTNLEFAEFHDVLQKQDKSLQDDINKYINKNHNSLKQHLKKNLKKTAPNLYKKLRDLLIPKTNDSLIVISGDKEGFTDFLECANYLDSNFAKFTINAIDN